MTRLCSIEGCARPHKGRGFCKLHLRRFRENGDPHQAKKPKPFKPCSVEGCDGKHFAHGWCRKHYLRWWDHGSTETLSGRAERNELEKFLLLNVAHEGGDCIVWPYTKAKGGYGALRVNGEYFIASHLMCCLAHGEPPTPIHQAAHSCGNRPCINPNHIRWATPAENDADKLIHGTHTRGERNANAKLTESDVRAIRANATRRSLAELSKQFGVTESRIDAVIKRIGWKHIP